ncbi:hypothetical protein PoB_006942200 [Plakobranchus ocellatus]|uniref:Response regulatory domain-containing protein n=1 Tax=Plakobranchus ocellatus TaxID=259542 RepID=A0AAV4DFA6_9GAST|nr:hypothetical protein PoB_006942200 [Plakobranchus ocellatus]
MIVVIVEDCDVDEKKLTKMADLVHDQYVIHVTADAVVARAFLSAGYYEPVDRQLTTPQGVEWIKRSPNL